MNSLSSDITKTRNEYNTFNNRSCIKENKTVGHTLETKHRRELQYQDITDLISNFPGRYLI